MRPDPVHNNGHQDKTKASKELAHACLVGPWQLTCCHLVLYFSACLLDRFAGTLGDRQTFDSQRAAHFAGEEDACTGYVFVDQIGCFQCSQVHGVTLHLAKFTQATLRRGAAEAIEAVAHGDRNSSRVVGRAVEDIKLPQGTSIGAIVRRDKVLIAHHDTIVQSEDHVILFLVDKHRIPEVERLFQVGITFL